VTKLNWSKANLVNPDPARVIDVGHWWSRDAINSKRAKKKKRYKNNKMIVRSSIQSMPLIIPERAAGLIGSIFRDLGQALPARPNKLNNRLRRLIEQGVISAQGEIVSSHPVIQQWFDRVKGGALDSAKDAQNA
jgi:hypothetical protein